MHHNLCHGWIIYRNVRRSTVSARQIVRQDKHKQIGHGEQIVARKLVNRARRIMTVDKATEVIPGIRWLITSGEILVDTRQIGRSGFNDAVDALSELVV